MWPCLSYMHFFLCTVSFFLGGSELMLSYCSLFGRRRAIEGYKSKRLS